MLDYPLMGLFPNTISLRFRHVIRVITSLSTYSWFFVSGYCCDGYCCREYTSVFELWCKYIVHSGRSRNSEKVEGTVYWPVQWFQMIVVLFKQKFRAYNEALVPPWTRLWCIAIQFDQSVLHEFYSILTLHFNSTCLHAQGKLFGLCWIFSGHF